MRHTAPAVEAVTDDPGRNVVYSTPDGSLHWFSMQNGADADLGISGSAPALTPIGNKFVFLTPEGALAAYEHATSTLTVLASGPFREFALTDTEAAFAVESSGRLVRLNFLTGEHR